MSSENTIRIMIVEDHFMVRVGLSAIINSQNDMTVIAEATNGIEAIEQYRRHQPDVTLMDLRIPGKDGVESIIEIIKEYPQARIIVISTYGGDEDIYRAIQAGARYYYLKHVDGQELIKAIRSVYMGECPLPPEVATRLVERMRGTDLSHREMEVFELIARGKSNREISEALNIAESTVRVYISHLLNKLGCNNRGQLVAEAYQRGIVSMNNASRKSNIMT